MRLLEGRVAIVTGSGRGIGRAIAQVLARHGARVVVNDRDAEPLGEVREVIRGEGGEVLAVQADVSEASEVDRLLEATLETYGRLDVLVNNARAHLPSGELGPFVSVTDEAWHAFMRLNLGNLFVCTRRAAPLMLRQRSGSIVNVGSVGAIRAHRQMIPYDTYKGAMEAFTRAVAVDFAPWNVRVNALQPGSIAVEWAAGLGEDELRRRGAAIPMGRMGTPEEVADCALFLASDLSRYVTGQVFAVDGGLVAQARTPQSEQVVVATPETLDV